MCVWFPDWPIQRRRAAPPEPDPVASTPALNDRPANPVRTRPRDSPALVLYHEQGRGAQRVAACCPQARAGGVGAGMPVAEARALLEGRKRTGGRPFPAPQFLPVDPAADQEALRRLAWRLLEFSPHVGLEPAEEPESLLLEISGCAHLFGGEAAMMQRVRRALQDSGWQARLALADTVGAAWAAARFGPRSLTILPTGEQRAFLEPWPPAALRLSGHVVGALEELGVQTIRQLLALPRSSLPSRFGPHILERLDQALGTIPETFPLERPPEPIAVSRRWEWPLEERRAVEAALCEMLTSVVTALQRRGLATQRLRGTLQHAQGGETPLDVGLVSPTASQKRLEDLLRAKCDRLAVHSGISGITLEAIDPRPLPRRQGTLFEMGHEAPLADWEALLERLGNRLGESAVVWAESVSDPLPERAFRYQPITATPRDQSPPPSFPRDAEPVPEVGLRPLCLFSPPRPVAVVASPQDGQPRHVRWTGYEAAVVRCWGPERMETGWWRSASARRDYYRVETEDGRWLWLFQDLKTEDWRLHGAFE